MQLQLQQQQQQQLQEQAQYQYVKFEDLTDEQQFQLLLLQQQQAPLLGQEDFELRWDLEQADSCEDEALQYVLIDIASFAFVCSSSDIRLLFLGSYQ